MASPDLAVPEASATGSPRSRWLGFGVLAAGLAMIVLDGTVVNVALPAIIDDLDLALNEAQWVTCLYAVIFAALLLTSGRLGDRYGRRLMFLIGVGVFVAASFAAAGANDSGELIWSRCAQGFGAAFILPATLSTVNATFRGRDRSMAFGIWGAVMAGAAAVGPLIGGWLTTSLSWRWIFLVNLPIGLFVVLAGSRWIALASVSAASWAAWSSRERRMRRACSLFCSWLFSFCIATTIPVGRWVIRTAESVVLTDCPPGPLER